jgi:uncharacterized protein (TIGR02452 family)
MTEAFDAALWLAAFEAAKSRREFQVMKDLRRRIARGTIEYTKALPSLEPLALWQAKTEALPAINPLAAPKATTITVRDLDCLESERQLRERGLNPVVLNMASSHRPGGGWLNGAGAQEEGLFYRSDYARHLPQNLYPFRTPLTAIYTLGVSVFRESEIQGYAFSKVPRLVSFIAAAAPKEPELTPEGELPEATLNLTKDKIRQVLRLALLNNHDSIVLSAWGCGAYKNPARSVARAFRTVLCDEEEFKGQFAAVEFAIFDDHNAPKGTGNLAVFREVFEGV